MNKTTIAWADSTWNFLSGCSRVSEGCRFCYAERIASRFSGPGQPYEHVAYMASAGPRWTGMIKVNERAMEAPLNWKEPRRIFVASMSDPHHPDVSDELRDIALAVIAFTPRHTYLWLTKRAEEMRRYFLDPATPFRIQKAMDTLTVDRRTGPEEWRPIIGYEGHYEVSNAGAVRSKTGRFLKPLAVGRGYQSVALSKNAHVTHFLIQHLVLEAFIGAAEQGQEARHANGCASDNRISNLSWGTRFENMADAARHGTAGVWMKSRAMLTVEQVADIRRLRAAGEKCKDIAVGVGSNLKQVSAIARGKIYKPAALPWPFANLHLGVSVEDQATANERIPLLLQTPAALRWISYEPALGPVDFRPFAAGLSWLVIGGESGPGARPFNLEWAKAIIDHGKHYGIPVFCKQIGSQNACQHSRKGEHMACWPKDLQVREYPHNWLRIPEKSEETLFGKVKS